MVAAKALDPTPDPDAWLYMLIFVGLPVLAMSLGLSFVGAVLWCRSAELFEKAASAFLITGGAVTTGMFLRLFWKP